MGFLDWLRSKRNVTTFGIKFDGLYVSQKYSYTVLVSYSDPYSEGEVEQERWSQQYFRFYPDGRVVCVSSDAGANPKLIAKWLTLDHPHVSKGAVTVQKSGIEFRAVGSNGAVVYSGTLKDGQLVLQSRSEINGFESTVVCDFVSMQSMG